LHRKKPPCIARNGRAAAPARARGTFCAMPHPPALAASRPLHARTAKPRRARWQRSRRGSRPRQWGSASRAPRPPVPACGEVRRDPHPPALAASRPLHACTAMKRPCFAGNGRAAAPARARGTFCADAKPARPRVTPVACSDRDEAAVLAATGAPLPPARVARASRTTGRPPALARHARCTLAARCRSPTRGDHPPASAAQWRSAAVGPPRARSHHRAGPSRV
jgi:hypothetical protein